jgi:hypothetical protein
MALKDQVKYCQILIGTWGGPDCESPFFPNWSLANLCRGLENLKNLTHFKLCFGNPESAMYSQFENMSRSNSQEIHYTLISEMLREMKNLIVLVLQAGGAYLLETELKKTLATMKSLSKLKSLGFGGDF